MKYKYTQQPGKARSQKASQETLKSWQCLKCGFGFRNSKKTKCRLCGSKSLIQKEVLARRIKTNKYLYTDKGLQREDKSPELVRSNKWEKTVKKGPQLSNRNQMVDLTVKKHAPNGWSCCDTCRDYYSKMGSEFMRAVGSAARRTILKVFFTQARAAKSARANAG